MNISITLLRGGLLALAAIACMHVHATEIYKWTDENGVVHFSQTRPPSADEDVQELVLQDRRPSGWEPGEDIYGVEEQAERMKALREDMEKKRQERLERKARENQQRALPYPETEYYAYPIYRRPQPPLRPVPPIERPGAGPGDPIRPPGMIKPPSPLKPN